MSIQAYKAIQTGTESGLQLSERIMKTIVSYLNEYRNGSLEEKQRKEALLKAHTICQGALFSIAHNPENTGIITLRNVIELTSDTIMKELTGDETDLVRVVDLLKLTYEKPQSFG